MGDAYVRGVMYDEAVKSLKKSEGNWTISFLNP
jgi:hypothetical protein